MGDVPAHGVHADADDADAEFVPGHGASFPRCDSRSNPRSDSRSGNCFRCFLIFLRINSRF
jgi:hypothetical protein